MAKTILKQIAGTIAQGLVLKGKGIIVVGSLFVPKGYLSPMKSVSGL